MTRGLRRVAMVLSPDRAGWRQVPYAVIAAVLTVLAITAWCLEQPAYAAGLFGLAVLELVACSWARWYLRGQPARLPTLRELDDHELMALLDAAYEEIGFRDRLRAYLTSVPDASEVWWSPDPAQRRAIDLRPTRGGGRHSAEDGGPRG